MILYHFQVVLTTRKISELCNTAFEAPFGSSLRVSGGNSVELLAGGLYLAAVVPLASSQEEMNLRATLSASLTRIISEPFDLSASSYILNPPLIRWD